MTLWEQSSCSWPYSVCCDQVAIHVGIASGSKCIILEQTGKNSGYKDRDVCGICPADNCCIQGGAECLDSIIDMRSIAKSLKGFGLDVIYCRDAGRFVLLMWNAYKLYYCNMFLPFSCDHARIIVNKLYCIVSVNVFHFCRYLCDFIYYLSLHYGQRRAAFIHVPACGSEANPERLVPQLQTIIQVMLCQLDTQRIRPAASECRRGKQDLN